jgi:hypothetical protein
LDFAGKPLQLVSLGTLLQPAGGSYELSDGAGLEAPITTPVLLQGAVRLGLNDAGSVGGQQLQVDVQGTLELLPQASLEVAAPLGMLNSGDVTLYGAALAAEGGVTHAAGSWTMYGDLVGDFTNQADMLLLADTQLIGNLANASSGVLVVQGGTFTVLGDFDDQGTTIGDVTALPKRAAPEDPGKKLSAHALSVLGDYRLGAEAGILSPAGGLTLKVGGSFDCAIDDNSRFDLAQAELRMIGLGQNVQQLEVMSKRVGKDLSAFDRNLPGHFPIETLRVGPTPTQVSLVDQHDNDGLGQATCEALYVRNLVIESGATLLTNECRVYYEQLTLLGSVDNPAYLIDIHSATGADEPVDLPTVTRLAQNVPNPFNPSTEIAFDLAVESQVRLEIFDTAGRRVCVLVNEVLPRGTHRVRWLGEDERGRPVASGAYHVRFTAGDVIATRRATLVR